MDKPTKSSPNRRWKVAYSCRCAGIRGQLSSADSETPANDVRGIGIFRVW